MAGTSYGAKAAFFSQSPEEGLKVFLHSLWRKKWDSTEGLLAVPLFDVSGHATVTRKDVNWPPEIEGNFIYTAPNISLATG
ncbi:hypothetical protein AVEN_245601-1 [Araneus ventricosus]|uniref:Uncharacterized protein n=1 Tax=Araneus ventricosus TaxID=182803 RepID=A0A4Y2IVH7_ARAVE|nr:hypothetical protein AVEN_245601-1 [Araneus ventricosus]